jgi:hypothetical protein
MCPEDDTDDGCGDTPIDSQIAEAAPDLNQSGDDGEDSANDVAPPQHLLAEAINRMQHVILTWDSQPDGVPGILAFDETTNAEITKTLGAAYNSGVEVGGMAATTSNVTILSSISTSDSTSVGPSIGVSSSGPATGVSGSQSKGTSKTREVAAAEALRQDQAARAKNASAVDRTATRLEGVQLQVSTSNASIEVMPGRQFWKTALTREVDLIYRRGVVVGSASASRSPAIAPRK